MSDDNTKTGLVEQAETRHRPEERQDRSTIMGRAPTVQGQQSTTGEDDVRGVTNASPGAAADKKQAEQD
jgi:hypothetical protein